MKLPKPLVAVVGVFMLISIPFLLKYHHVGWDEAVYLGMGKALWSAGSIGLWESIRPVGLPVLLGLLWRLNLPLVFFSQLLLLLFAVFFIAATYALSRQVFGAAAAAIAVLLLAFHPVFLDQSLTIMTSVPAAALGMLSLLFFMRGRLAIASAVAGLAFLFRFPAGIFIVAMLLAEAMVQLRQQAFSPRLFLSLAVPFSLVTAPFFALNVMLYHQHASNVIVAALRPIILGGLHQANPVHAAAEGILYYPLQLLSSSPLLAFSLLGIAGAAAAAWKKPERSAAAVIALLLLFAYFTAIVNKQLRFAVLFLPFLAVFSAQGICIAIAWARRRRGIAVATVAIIMLLATYSFFIAAAHEQQQYARSLAEAPPVVTEFHKYFLLHEVNGSILTTDPTAAAFVDKKFVPYYDSPAEALKMYDESHGTSGAVVYTPGFFPCNYYSESCELQKQQLWQMILDDNVAIFNKSYSGNDYFIFVPKMKTGGV